MKIKKTLFGNFNNQGIYMYELLNDNNMIVKIMDYGATITSISIPGEKDREELACGFDTLEGYFSEEYKNNAPYFGCTVGRYCSQIKNSTFELNGSTYSLSKNCGDNNLHGGTVGFDKKIWKAEIIKDQGVESLQMTLNSPDLEEGFPGNVDAVVRFSLNNNNEIIIEYKASTDKDTPLSMTNHTYFNLSGFKRDITSFKVIVNSDKKQEMDETGASTGNVISVENKSDDLRDGKIISDVHKAMGGGFEHFYVFNPDFELKELAVVTDPQNNRKLTVSSTEPCMLLYTGTYTSDNLARENGDKYGKHRGFCCETHRYQNGPNIPGSPKTITKAGEEFNSKTVFKLSW